MSDSGALGSLIPESREPGGDWELGSLGMGYWGTDGELYPELGPDPDEYTEDTEGHISDRTTLHRMKLTAIIPITRSTVGLHRVIGRDRHPP